jgi:hypothetical protein
LLTLGLVGSGKTSFLHYTAKVTGRERFIYAGSGATAHWIYIDFRDYSDSQDARAFMIDRMFAYIQEHPFLRDFERCVRHVYGDQIAALKSGPLAIVSDKEEYLNERIAEILVEEWKKREPYALKVIAYAARNAPVFLVVDNVDQIEKIESQSQIFSESTALARSIRANLILAMRDATYVKNRSSAVFDAFDFDAVYIDPPSILAVLSRRFDVAEQLLKGKRIEFDSEGGARIIMRDGSTIISLLRASVLGTEVGRIIEVAATGDTRLALQMTRQFLQYGYTSTAKAVEIYQRRGNYTLPPHEALRAIMLGNQGVYREEFSIFGNPFDSKLGRSDLQFLRLYIMAAVVSYSSEREFEGISTADVIDNLEKLGISEHYSEIVIKDLLKLRYVFSRSHREYTRESLVMPSRLCGYVVRELIGRLVFLETVLFDTFISDDSIWDALKENMRLIYRERNVVGKLGMRKEAVSLFFDFVEERFERLAVQARARGLSPQWCGNPITRVRTQFQQDLERALGSARRWYGSGEHEIADSRLPLFEPADKIGG